MQRIYSRTMVARAVLGACVMIVCSTRVRAQSDGVLELPRSSLRDITTDFDAGRNAIYCYHGHDGRTDASSGLAAPIVRVDSISAVTTPSACRGLGFAFISRIDDRAFLINALRGLIESSPAFRIVSAFYRTEVVEADGERIRSARALSVIRGAIPGIASHASNSDSRY